MAESIKESCKLGVAAYAAQAREQWVLEWPGQVVLAVSAIFWTSAVTNALQNGIPGQSSMHFDTAQHHQECDNCLLMFEACQMWRIALLSNLAFMVA